LKTEIRTDEKATARLSELVGVPPFPGIRENLFGESTKRGSQSIYVCMVGRSALFHDGMIRLETGQFIMTG